VGSECGTAKAREIEEHHEHDATMQSLQVAAHLVLWGVLDELLRWNLTESIAQAGRACIH
jgi:hypothetical protein